ncbi:MAG TPA: glutathione peroxidase [Fredinandcohnia sp.]|nr:glutathione peroxidase [Fredinandcohnia sp.]
MRWAAAIVGMGLLGACTCAREPEPRQVERPEPAEVERPRITQADRTKTARFDPRAVAEETPERLVVARELLAKPTAPSTVVLDHELQTLEGERFSLAALRGKVLLIVNVASNCGYTPQYAGLQALHEKYGPRGLVVIGIPSNDFGGQEPGSHEEIRAFCERQYGVTFPMMAKVHAKGPDIAPIYRTLTQETEPPIAGEVKWNFTKFLVNKDGVPVARFEPKVEPLSEEIVRAIESLL